MTQNEALQILKMGHSVFLTGAAGTGKTYVLNQYINYLKTHKLEPTITASTGIAATHINGSTLHSFSGIGIIEKLNPFLLDKLSQNERLFKKYEKVKVLIIDEISMLHASKLDMVNVLFKKFLHSPTPFAKVQVIFCGDFFQLPPVLKNYKEKNSAEEDKEFAYNSQAWQELNPVICYLEENYRQKEDDLLSVLNSIREQKDLEKVCQALNEHHSTIETKNILKLYTHNLDVDSINLDKYSSLATQAKEYTFKMQSTGRAKLVENLKNNCLARETLNLKKGTKVIFIKNDRNRIYQNGTLGEVVGFSKENLPVIKTFYDKIITPTFESWQSTNEDGKVIAEISQLPLRYAWAITVHKSQGMTLDAAEIDLSRAFGSGMGYVALSRVKKLQNIKLLGVSREALYVNRAILLQDKIFREKSQRAQIALAKYLDKDLLATQALVQKQNNFILSLDGEIIPQASQEKDFKEKSSLETRLITLEFIQEKTPLLEIAQKRNLKTETILNHLETLLKNQELKLTELKYILEEFQHKHSVEDLRFINKTLQSNSKLKEVKNVLENDYKIKIDYLTLKVLRLNF